MPAPKAKSKDPRQQQLRDQKQEWNHNYSYFSQRLKAFKDGLNGRGNSKAGLPPSSIKEPLPGEIGSFLNGLAGEFQSIVSGAESVIANQAQYSKTRRRRKPKEPKQLSNAPPTQPTAEQAPAAPAQDQIAETLSRLGEYEIATKKEASNKLSRFWQYLSAIFSRKEYNRQRVGLLSQSADLYYSLLDLENDVLSLSISNVPNTIAKYKKFKYNFDTFVGTFRGVEAMIERQAEKNGIKNPEKKEETQQITQEQPEVPAEEPSQPYIPLQPPTIPDDLKQIKQDMHDLFNASVGKDGVAELNRLFSSYEEEDDPHRKSMWADRLKEYHSSLTNMLANEVQKKYGPANIRSIRDVIDLVIKNRVHPNRPNYPSKENKAEYVSDYMIKTSHNKFTRYLKKKLVKALPFNKTAPVRLELVEVLGDMKTTIKSLMDNLEKDLSMEELKIYMETLIEDKDRLKRPLHVLNTFFMKDFFTKKENSKRKQKGRGKDKSEPFMKDDEELMDYVLQRKLKRELGEDLG